MIKFHIGGDFMEDAICAIATPYGIGAISIIRCSGFNSISLVNKLFKGFNLLKALPNTIHYGYIMDGDEVLDEVMVSVFKAPKSFTAEDSVEINCHGGIYNTNLVLELLLKNGFRLALPGEFSKRAFLNGRIDLTQGEAIMDLINASSKNALRSSIHSLRKGTTKLITSLREELLDLIAKIEVNIDYPEYEDAIVMTDEIVLPMLNKMILKMDDILEHSKISNMAIHGIKTAIVGRPNVGKSSLLNELLEEDKAIVTSIAGTTRDTIEAPLRLGDVILNLIDTAGIRKSDDLVEKIGIEKSMKSIEEADLVLLVLDGSKKLQEEDLKLLDLTKNKKRIIILNKSDLKVCESLKDAIHLSAKTGEGMEDLIKKLKEVSKIDTFNPMDSNYLSNARHIAKLKESRDLLISARDGALKHIDIDMLEIDIKESWNILGEIIGQTNKNELLDELFSKFCLGK